ncbi:MAG TPA: SGNH/GDSL hydrolase family protein, partial [Chitinophagaceae bacterium]|nr:SGNH/GDSL hydrolase family protein [Chitinophagaceae bacterium]
MEEKPPALPLPLRYLALGDSYTIGEGVPLFRSFPYQAVQELRRSGIPVSAPEILARTGWTTGELEAAMSGYVFQPPYDFVTLLIGVNNQYRGKSVDTYVPEFRRLLEAAIGLAGSAANRVAVLSIPDWGATPFAEGRDQPSIYAAIDAYNAANRQLTEAAGAQYIDITPGSRQVAEQARLVTEDGLHPSPEAYREWVVPLVKTM